MHELPLILFTTFIQMSIGCVLFAVIYFLCQPNADIRLPMWLGLITGVLGGIASISHLGNPWHLLNTINNVVSSWMSREVIFVGAYVGLVVFNVLCHIFSQKFNRTLLSLTASLGVATIFVMSNIYINSLFTLWTGIVTYSLFSSTALLAGSSLAYVVLNNAHKQFGIFALIGFALNVIVFIYLQNHLTDNATLAMTAKYVDSHLVTILSWTKLALLAVCLAIMTKFIKKQPVAIVACLLIILAEFIGRIAYFCLAV